MTHVEENDSFLDRCMFMRVFFCMNQSLASTVKHLKTSQYANRHIGPT